MLLNGISWEMKNPTGCGEMTIFTQFKKAVMGRAWVNTPQASRLVISNYGNDMPFEWLESKIQLVVDNNQLDGDQGDSRSRQRWRAKTMEKIKAERSFPDKNRARYRLLFQQICLT